MGWFAKRKNTASVGILSLITMLGQVYISKQSDKNMVHEFDKLKLELVEMKLEQEQHLVKKEELKDLSRKLDLIHKNLEKDIGKVDTQVADIRAFLKKTYPLFSENSLFFKHSFKFSQGYQDSQLRPASFGLQSQSRRIYWPSSGT